MTAQLIRSNPSLAQPWDVVRGKYLMVSVPAGSYAASRARQELRNVERAIEAVEKIIGQKVPDGIFPLAVYLSDLPAAEVATLPSADYAVIYSITAESPRGCLVAPVLQTVLPTWLGGGAAQAPFLLAGLIAVVSGRLGLGATRTVANDAVREALQKGAPVSILAEWEKRDPSMVAHSFVAYLLEISPGSTLRQLLKNFDSSRRDESALGSYQRPLATLEAAWLAQLQRRATSGSALSSLLRYVGPEYKPYMWRQAEIFAYMLLSLAFGLSFPFGSKYLIDTVIPGGNVQLLVGVILAMLVVEALNALVGLRRAYLTSSLNGEVTNNLQNRVFLHLQKLPHRFYANARVGDLLARLSSDVQVIQGALAQSLGVGLFLSMRIVVVVVSMLTLNPWLGVVILVAVPIFSAIYLSLRSRLQSTSLRVRGIYGEVAATTQESLSAHTVIKAFGLEERMSGNYRSRLASLLSANLGLVVVGSLFETSVVIASSFGQLAILGIGGYLVLSGQATIGTLLAVISLLPSVFQPIAMLAGIGQTVEQASGSLERFKELLETPVEIEDKATAAPIGTISKNIEFKDVNFSYEAGRPILNTLNLNLPAGKHIAVVGPSGSGKSTLINLLLRFWDPDQGQVLLDGHDLRDLRLASLRGAIGIVFQDTFVFDTTLRENIAIGRTTASDAEILAAAKAARLDEYIASLPAGIDTLLGERGVRMSGGQRQRLAIARAILRNPQLLILDEATSALDAQTERDILDTFIELTHGRTTISITHRLTLAAAADWIVVIDKGQVVEQGSHEELLKQGGLYYHLYQEQYGKPTGRLLRSEEALALRTIPLFKELSDPALATLVSNVATEHHPAETVIVRQGDPGDKLYFIKQGEVEVLVNDEGISRPVTTLKAQDYFGELTLLSVSPRTATVRTLTPTEVYTLTHADFLTILGQSGELRDVMAHVLATRRAALEGILTKPVAATVAMAV